MLWPLLQAERAELGLGYRGAERAKLAEAGNWPAMLWVFSRSGESCDCNQVERVVKASGII